MKTLIMAAAFATVTMGTAASANDLSFNMGMDYSVNAESVDGFVGASFSANDQLTLLATVNADWNNNINFTGANIAAEFQADEKLMMFIRGEFDDNIDHSETVLGVRIDF